MQQALLLHVLENTGVSCCKHLSHHLCGHHSLTDLVIEFCDSWAWIFIDSEVCFDETEKLPLYCKFS